MNPNCLTVHTLSSFRASAANITFFILPALNSRVFPDRLVMNVEKVDEHV